MITIMMILSPFIWLLYLLATLPLYLLGFILIPIATFSGAYETRKSNYYNYDIIAWSWPFMYIYGNEEEGIYSGMGLHDTGAFKSQVIYWTMIRNPINNLRFIRPFSLLIDKDKVKYIGSEADIHQYDTPKAQWWFIHQGLYSGYWNQFYLKGKLMRFWIGWAIYPTDTLNGPSTYQKYGTMFTIQFKAVE